jgi:hypothetical protein
MCESRGSHRQSAVRIVAVASLLVASGVVTSGASRFSAAATVPAVWTQQGTFSASDPALNDHFGTVDLSGDGNTAIVGAPNKALNANSQVGAAYIFVRSGSSWVQQAQLRASDAAAGDAFGATLAISTDGSTAVIGAPFKTLSGMTKSGAAYVFVRAGTVWTQAAELMGSPSSAGDNFGASVSIAGIGTVVAVGAPRHAVAGHVHAGEVSVFKRAGTNWTASGTLTASDAATGDGFGHAVIVKEQLVLVSAPLHSNANGSTGAVYEFDGSTGSYVQKTVLTASDGHVNDDFGWSLDLSLATMLIGTPGHALAGHGTGAVYVFTHNDTTGIWTQRAILAPPDGNTDDNFGATVAISDGTVAIGDTHHDVGTNHAEGAIYLFTGAAATWTQQAEITASDATAGTNFGQSVAIYPTTAMVGEPRHSAATVHAAGIVAIFTSA